MKSSVAPLEGNKVKLSVEVDEDEFDRDIDAAFRVIAKEVRLPGFRPGKAPRRILEARIGLAPAREQALRDGIPQYLARAVREHDVDIIATPEVDITAGQEDGPVAFDATVEVRPKVAVPGYNGLRVELPSPDVSDDDVQAVVDQERRRQGELTDIDRPAARGDFVTVDLAATKDGEPVPGLNTEDWLYEVGKGWVAADFDDQLVGATPGDELSFSSNPSGMTDPADFEVTVKKVQELVLPATDDAWVAENLGEFETLDAWQSSIRERLAAVRVNQARQMLVERTTGALAELVDDEAPESLVNDDLRHRIENLLMQLQAQGMQLEQYLAITGQDQVSFTEGLKDASVRAVKTDLALRSVAESEALEVEPEDIEAEYIRIAAQVKQKPGQVKKAYERNDAVFELVGELRKRKALEWLLDRVEIVDPEGRPIERTLIIPADETEDSETADGGNPPSEDSEA
jgi:trigger factor